MRLMRFNVLFGVGQNIAAPFFIAYALGSLKFNYAWLQIFATLASATSLASMPLWGYLGDKFGNKPLMAISVVGTFTLPLFWVIASPAHHDFAAFLIGANNASAGFFLGRVQPAAIQSADSPESAAEKRRSTLR